MGRGSKDLAVTVTAAVSGAMFGGPIGFCAGLLLGIVHSGRSERDVVDCEVVNEADHVNLYNPESAETSIARNNPYVAAELLENVSKERVYQETIAKGYDSVNKYMEGLPEGSLDKASGVNVSLERRVDNGFFSSGNSEEYRIKFKIKK